MFGAPTRGLAQTFPKLPTVQRLKLRRGLDLVLIAINSEKDVGYKGMHRLLARGRFDSQIRDTRSLVGGPSDSEVRVLIMHHSPSHRGTTLAISNRMRRLWEDFVSTLDIRVVLTGHVHEVGASLLSFSANGRVHEILEARSGTTTQRDYFDPPWQPRSQSSANSLLVHNILERTDGSLEWEVRPFIRTRRGFVPTRFTQTFGPPAVVVWP
jgi:hypothetical protein